MSEEGYSTSIRKRLRILFSPMRLILFILAVVVLVVANLVYMGRGGSPEWLGVVSVVPILAFLFWELSTDLRMRRADRERRGRAN